MPISADDSGEGNGKTMGAEPGDRVEVTGSDGRKSTGILMPKHDSAASEIITLKLDSGYNVGIKIDLKSPIRVISRKKAPRPASIMSSDGTKPVVAVLSTGGTIASFVDYDTGAVHPALTAEGLVDAVPELLGFCTPKARVLYSLLSEDMKPEHWKKIAEETAAELNTGAKGVIIAHGTDTMGYTAAALSFMLTNLTGPVILVGSQRSSDRPSTDAALNITAAAKLAVSSDIGEVVVVMHGSVSDDFCAVHRGTRVRKMHTSRRDAFQTINEEPIGRVSPESIELQRGYRRTGTGNVLARTHLEDRVALIQFYPGMSVNKFESMTHDMKGVVIAGTGLGHVSSDLVKAIEKAISGGMIIVMVSQCIHGSVNLNVYSNGRRLLDAGIISAGDMLPETAYVKLMWTLGNAKDKEEVKRMMQTNIAGELANCRDWSEPLKPSINKTGD